MQLRYGINPGSTATVTSSRGQLPFRVLHGEPSYVNLLDALNGWQLVHTMKQHTGKPAAASFKHVSPAGAAVAGELDTTMRATWRVEDPSPATSAYIRARDADPRASYGDFIAVSEPVDTELAEFIGSVLSDGIIAPSYEPGVLDVLARKKNGTYLVLEGTAPPAAPLRDERDLYRVHLTQERDVDEVTASLPALSSLSENERIDAIVGLATVRFTQSNAIALVSNGMAIGIGAGQQSRVDCTRLAGSKAATWWPRRHPRISQLAFHETVRRQERLNVTMRLIEGDLTSPEEEAARASLTEEFAPLDHNERTVWMKELNGVTLVSDGLIPFTDNIDHAARYGVDTIIEPGGSSRTPTVTGACEGYGIRHIQTGQRLFHH